MSLLVHERSTAIEYSIRDFAHMIADPVRMPAYRQALARMVWPGCVVADIGAGTGALSLFAARLGARKVYAIERDDAIEVARQIVARNGLDQQIVCIQALSTDVELPEKADVIVSDLHGVLPLYNGHLPAIIDARSRLLASGGVQIPATETLNAALAETSEEYERNVAVWEDDDLDLGNARDLAVNSWWRVQLDASSLLSSPAALGSLDYTAVAESRFAGRAELYADRGGTAHGICVWFESELARGIGFSNAPGGLRTIYGQALFPFPRPLVLAKGDRVSVQLDASLLDEDYAFSWKTTAAAAGETVTFSQSSILGALITPRRLAASRLDLIPVLAPDGEAARRALQLADGQNTTEAIAGVIAVEFPELFPDERDAIRLVVDLVRQYASR